MQLYFYKTFIKYWNCNSAIVRRLKKIFRKIIMLLQKGFHHIVEPLWAIALLCYTTTCIYFPYNLNSYIWWRQKSVAESFHRKWGIWFIAMHKAYIKQTQFHSSSISIRIVKLGLTFFAKKGNIAKRFKVSKKPKTFYWKWASTYCD